MPGRKKRKPSVRTVTTRRGEAYERALHAVSLMRREGRPLAVAAKEAGTSPEMVLHLARPALRRVRGHWKAKPRDRLERRLLFYDTKGSLFVTVRSSATASRIGEYHAAIKKFLETGKSVNLKRFARKFMMDAKGKRHRFVTDAPIIRQLARAAQFRFESIY